MPLSGDERRALKARAHRLKSRITVGKTGLTDSLIVQIRRALQEAELLKVRIQHPHREEVDRIAQRIAEQVPCELVGRTGFVATFYRPPERDAEMCRPPTQGGDHASCGGHELNQA